MELFCDFFFDWVLNTPLTYSFKNWNISLNLWKSPPDLKRFRNTQLKHSCLVHVQLNSNCSCSLQKRLWIRENKTNSLMQLIFTWKRVNSVAQILTTFPRYSLTISCIVITLFCNIIWKIGLNLWFASVIKLYQLLNRTKSYNPAKIC